MIAWRFLLSMVIVFANYSKTILAIRGCDDGRDGYMCAFYKSCGKSFALTGKAAYIIGGSNVKPKEFPSFAQVRIIAEAKEGRGDSACSAVIVSDRHIATAAHCLVREFLESNDKTSRIPVRFVKAQNIRVVVGEDRNFLALEVGFYKRLRVHSYCVHTHYTEDNLYRAYADVALLTLERALKFDDYIQPACWPYDFQSESLYGSEENRWRCYQVGIGISGWAEPPNGKPYDKPIVQKMEIAREPCPPLLAGSLCFGGTAEQERASACYGDSGGPALCLRPDTNQWTVVGLMSRPYGEGGWNCKAGGKTLSGFPDQELDLSTEMDFGSCIGPWKSHLELVGNSTEL